MPPRTMSAAEPSSLAPHGSKARLRVVTKRRDPWRSHVHRTRFRRPRSSSSLKLPMQRGRGGRPLVLSLGGLRGILSFEKESIPLKPPRERTRGLAPRPRTLADRHLKSCAACGIGCGVRGFATGPCESIHVATAPYYREARMTVVRQRTACGGGFAALAGGGIAAFLFQQCSFL